MLVNERDNELTVIKKAKQIMSFEFGDLQLLDSMNFLGGETNLVSFLKAYKTSETKRFFPYGWFDHTDKMQKTELPPYDAFYAKFCIFNPLVAEYNDYVNLLKIGMTTDEAVVKLKLPKPPRTGVEVYQYLQQIWKQHQMRSFEDFFRWHNNVDAVPTLEAIQKTITFTHCNVIYILKFGSTLPKLATFCLHNYSDTKIYPFTEADENLWEHIRENVVGGLCIVSTRKVFVDETFIRKSTNICKSIVGIDASQLHPYSIFQPMPTGHYTRWDLNPETSTFTPRQNKTRCFEIIVMCFCQRTRPDCKINNFYKTGRRKKFDCLSFDGFGLIATLCSKQ